MMRDTLGNKTNPTRLSFRTAQDALNFAGNTQENFVNGSRGKNIDLAEHYKRGDFEISLELAFTVGGNSDKYDLIFCPVPLRAEKDSAVAAVSAEEICTSSPYHAGRSTHKWPHETVLIGVVQTVQGPQGVISSLVRLERHKERKDFIRNVFASAAANHVRFEFVETVGNREVRAFGGDFSSSDGASIPDLVEGISQVGDGILGGVSEFPRYGFDKSIYYEFVLGIRIDFAHQFVWICLPETFKLPLKVTNMLFALP